MQSGAYKLGDNPDGSLAKLILTPVDLDAPIPEDQHALQCDIAQVRSTLLQLERRGHNVYQYTKTLYGIAEVGLTGKAAQTDTAARSLAQLKAEIVETDGQYAKNLQAQLLGRVAAFDAMLGFCLYLPTYYYYPSYKSEWWFLPDIDFARLGMTSGDLILFRSFTFAWAGAMVGTWISYLWRNTDIGFSDLNRAKPTMLAAQIRLLFTGIQSMIVGVFVYFDIIAFRLGNFNTSDFYKESLVALLVGVLCGCSEQILPQIIAGKADEINKGAAKGQENGIAEVKSGGAGGVATRNASFADVKQYGLQLLNKYTPLLGRVMGGTKDATADCANAGAGVKGQEQPPAGDAKKTP